MKTTMITALLNLIFICMIGGGCSSGTALTEKQKTGIVNMKGEYTFNMRDSTGSNLCEGTLNIIMPDSENVSGDIQVTKVYQENFPGLSAIGRKIEGKYYKQTGTLSIDANPVVTDNNVFINVKPSGSSGSLKGTWSYSTFAGVKNKGTFNAVKK
jgi:hypothetical protein